MNITTHDDVDEIFDHYREFIRRLREHFIAEKQKFEIRADNNDTDFITLVDSNIDTSLWTKSVTAGDTTWSF
jgi:hypothetical protein